VLLCGFDRREGTALDLYEQSGANWRESFYACHPRLGLGELSRLLSQIETHHPQLWRESGEALLADYGLRLSERLLDTLRVLSRTPLEFQNWVDEKSVGARELAPLMSLAAVEDWKDLLIQLISHGGSKSQVAQALEWSVELHLQDVPLTDLAIQADFDVHLQRLERLRRPRTSEVDERWRETVRKWPWPSHVQGQWQRFGDQAGLEIKLRTTSPQDLSNKLQRLLSIRDAWQNNP